MPVTKTATARPRKAKPAEVPPATLHASGHRYQQVASDLMAAIQDGTYPLGSMLPGELEIAQAFKIGRNTARTAIQQLVEMGMLSRRKRAGTRVEAVAPRNVYTAAISSLPELLEDANRSHLEILAIRYAQRLPEALAQSLDEAADDWLAIDANRVQTSSATAISIAKIFVPGKYQAIASELKGKVPWMHVLLGNRFGLKVFEVTQHVTAARISRADAQALQSLPGQPGLLITRSYFDKSGACFLVAQNLHPANSVTLMTRWRLEGKFA